MVIPIDPVLLALAATGLPRARPLIRDGWERRLDAVFAHGLAGFLARANASGLVDLDREDIVRLELRLESEAIHAVRLEGELIRLEQTLAILRAVVLKGAILAHGAYPDVALRPFTDLDLLVPSRHHAAAITAFERLGYVRSRPEPAPGFDARVAKALTLVHPGGVVIDLHRTLVAGILGESISVDELLATSRPILLGGVPIEGPSWEAHLVESTLHAVVGDGLARALSIRDIAQVALHPDLNAERAADLSRRWSVNAPVADGLRAAADGLGFELPDALSDLVDEHPNAESPAPAPVRSARSRLGDLGGGGLRRRITTARALLIPSRDFLRWNYGRDSSPRLHRRRWRDLYHRAGEARTGPPPFTQGVDAGDSKPLVARDPPVRPLPLGPSSPLTTDVKLGPQTAAPGIGTFSPRENAERDASDVSRSVISRQQRWTADRPQKAAEPDMHIEVDSGTDTGPAEDREAQSAEGKVQPDRSGADHGVATEPAPPRGVGLFVGGLASLAITAVVTRLGFNGAGVVLVPVAAVLFAVAASRRISRRHPDEQWVGRWLVFGVLAKLTASYLRYLTLVLGYESVGDATGYDRVGRNLARAWLGNGVNPDLPDLRRTNFIRWFTGVVYYVFGSNMVAGFFIFGLLALVGSYLWYRATVESVPMIDKRLYLALVLFVPSIVFWPSSIGKESLMQLGIGAIALGTAFLLRQRLLTGLAIGAAGGWLLWVVRPHLLALVTVSAGFAYIVGRARSREPGSGSLLGRPIGLIVIALIMAFTITQGAEFLGIEEFSLSSVETALDEQTERTSQGGSEFDTGGNRLNPLSLPTGVVTVLLRPFPWETDSPFQLLSSLESALLAGLIVIRLPSLRTALRRARSTPFLLYCWILTALYTATFASFANFGLLVRQRSLVLPALFVLLAIKPALDHSHDRDLSDEPKQLEPSTPP